jgi:hypothetical protein
LCVQCEWTEKDTARSGSGHVRYRVSENGRLGHDVCVDDRGLLELIYRSRAKTIAELSLVAHVDEAEVVDRVTRLEAEGVVTCREGVIDCTDPAAWTARVVGEQARTLQESTAAATARIEALVGQLPSLLRHWSVGEVSGDLAPVFARHGPHAAEDLWYDVSREASSSAWAVFPTVERFLTTDADRAARFRAAFAGKDSVRALLPRAALSEPRLLDLAARYAEAGVEFRVSDGLPSWFWVDGDMLALPFEWGEDWPTSVLGVRNAALAALARAFFADLWRSADPIAQTEAPWVPLLHLMRQGLTLDSASHRLGINPRTGRRRVAAAMEHYGVSTLFALGVAWSPNSKGSPARAPRDS